ncbi:MAG: SDR family NAD(P)-dependent oxidoreductase [Planctomycetota bacterium]|jgi:NAD(P)-dependent dehydrogenase (short-subunit alcohol dehydrogenase family)
MLNIDLSGKTTLVIGGARGIGAAIVKAAAQAGSNVAWTCRSDIKASEALAEEIKDTGVKYSFKAVDCVDSDASEQFIKDTISEYGRIDNLVYNAGCTNPVSFLDLNLEEWKRVTDINLTGAFIATHAVIPEMIKEGGGSIVLIGSAAVPTGGGGRADYISAKAGMEGLGRAITKEFSCKSIRCNIVHPSLIETDLLRGRYPDAEKRKEVGSQVPMGRLGQSEDIAYPTVFLLSDLASYITGQAIFVDGGRTFCK